MVKINEQDISSLSVFCRKMGWYIIIPKNWDNTGKGLVTGDQLFVSEYLSNLTDEEVDSQYIILEFNKDLIN